jgi:hypothetical protein
MGTPAWTKKWFKQDLVYWKKTGNDGEGGFEYDDPVEIKCRYEKKKEQVISGTGEQKLSRARFFASQQLEEGGYVYLGTLSDDAVGLTQSPADTEGSMRILAADEIPSPDGRTSLYIGYSNMGSYER